MNGATPSIKSKRLYPQDARDWFARKWAIHRTTWLVGEERQDTWPLSIVLNDLTERDVLNDMEGTRAWVQAWRGFASTGAKLEWATRKWSVGVQEIPMRVSLESAEAVAILLGRSKAWVEGRLHLERLLETFPSLKGAEAVRLHSEEVLINWQESDFTRLLSLLSWLQANPSSGLYLRQLPVPLVDTKWVERRRGAIADLAAALLGREGGPRLHEAMGLNKEPSRLRLRVLCPQLRRMVGGLCDIEAPAGEIANLKLEPEVVIIVENLNTGISLPDVPGAVAFMRLGLAVDQLDGVQWLPRANRHLYWGDLDTHGFAALARARRCFPNIVSFCMDETTLTRHSTLWGREDKPSRAEAAERLTLNELAVCRGLQDNRWGENLRLEQERIEWEWAMSEMAKALGEPIT